MDIFTEILDLLTKLENSLTCPVCDKKCIDPVRIKICGHYFCTDCLKSSKQEHNCPKCNEFYEPNNLDYENIAKTSEMQLADLRELMESLQKCNRTCTNVSQPLRVSGTNNILYKNNEYHLNFINTLGKTNAKGETPLHIACKKKKSYEVRELVESNVDINAKDYAGWAPLHEAVQSKSLEIIEYLLQKHCLIDIPGADYVTPLHQAASLDNSDIVKLLLKYGADKNAIDYNGLKPEDSTKSQLVEDILRAHNPTNEKRFFEVFLPEKVFLYCHSIDEHIKKKFEHCKDIQVVDKMDAKKHLTHFMVKKTHKISFKIMQAMLEGLQFLTDESVENYVNGNYFINISEYIFVKNIELNKGIRKAMLSALLKLPKLFDGINFYIEDHVMAVEVYHLKVDKVYLTKLIKTGGGRVLHRPPATRTCESEYVHPFFSEVGSGTYQCCNYIIYAESKVPELLYNMPELQHKSSKWLIDCVIHYEIID